MATDPRRFPEWQKDVASVRVDGEGVGAHVATTRQIGPTQQTLMQEVVRIDPPRSWAARGTGGAILANGQIDVEPLDDGRRSLVTFTLDFEAHGVSRALLPLVERMTRASAAKSYKRLKHLIEESPSSDSVTSGDARS